MENLYIYYIQIIFLSLIIINHLFEFYLTRRQLAAFHQNRSKVPDTFQPYISTEDHQKAINYGMARLQLSQWKLAWETLLFFYWFPFRGAERLYLAVPFTNINREVLFLISFLFIQMLLNLPWSIYVTFVLEEKFGFNRTTLKTFFTDRLKGMALGFLIGTPLLYLMLLIFDKLGDWWWPTAFVVVTLFQFFLVWIYPTVIAPLFNKFYPLEEIDLKSSIENLVQKAGLNAKEVFVMDASKRSSHGNAYFTGFGKNKRVVFFDTLLKDLDKNEILAILAHELGHMKLKHIPKSLISSLIISFIGFWLMGKLSQENWFYRGHFLRVVSPGALFLLFMQAIPIYTFWFAPISSWISRKREFEADAYAAKETKAQDLITGLLKLYKQNASPVVTDKVYSNFYHSHPPASERIEKLK